MSGKGRECGRGVGDGGGISCGATLKITDA